MFVPKVWLFPLFHWFVNFTLTDKHGTKNLQGLIHPWFLKDTIDVTAPILSVIFIKSTRKGVFPKTLK